METKNYHRLSYKERVVIETLLSEKKLRSFISKQLKRNRSTITREINKWIRNPCDTYKADLAHWCAQDDYLNKRNLDKISTYSPLKFYVYRGLLGGWSPEQIAGKIKLHYHGDSIMSISHEAIYTHIYTHNQGKLRKKLIALLLYSKSKRISRKGAKKGRTRAIGTLVERKTRFTHIVKLKNRQSKTVTSAFKKPLNKMDALFRKTMTYDNGMEMAEHKFFTKKTGMPVYFAHPYSSWERGTNENTNGLIRRYFPKKTDFNKITEPELKRVQDKLNNRPRKILGFLTPHEMLEKENGRYSDNFFEPLKVQKKLSEITQRRI